MRLKNKYKEEQPEAETLKEIAGETLGRSD